MNGLAAGGDSKSVRVLMTGPSTKESSGGVRTHVRNLQEAFDSEKCVELLFFPVSEGLYDREGWFRKIWRNFRAVYPFLRQAGDVDVIHINSTLDARSIIRDALYVLLGGFIKRKRVILQFHGGRPQDVRILASRMIRMVLDRVWRQAEEILFLSNAQREEFQAVFPDLKCLVVPNFVDMAGRLDRPQANESVVFLFLARLHQDKGVRQIFEAAGRLHAAGQIFQLVVCGDGPMRQWVEDKVAEPGVSEYTVYRGAVSGDEKDAVLSTANVMLLPTCHTEGFPYTLLEAFKYGMPIITSPVGAIVDVVDNDVNGYLIDAQDVDALTSRMERFCQDRTLAAVMGCNARRLVEQKYSMNQLRAIFSGLYGCRTA